MLTFWSEKILHVFSKTGRNVERGTNEINLEWVEWGGAPAWSGARWWDTSARDGYHSSHLLTKTYIYNACFKSIKLRHPEVPFSAWLPVAIAAKDVKCLMGGPLGAALTLNQTKPIKAGPSTGTLS